MTLLKYFTYIFKRLLNIKGFTLAKIQVGLNVKLFFHHPIFGGTVVHNIIIINIIKYSFLWCTLLCFLAFLAFSSV